MNPTLVPPITEEWGELFRFMNSKSLVPQRSGSLLWPVPKETEELAGRLGCANHSQRSFPFYEATWSAGFVSHPSRVLHHDFSQLYPSWVGLQILVESHSCGDCWKSRVLMFCSVGWTRNCV